MLYKGAAAFAAFALALAAASAQAQVQAGPETEATQLDDVLVLARQAQIPIWEVSRGDRSLILVGDIRGVPRDLRWNPEALEAATARADRILYPPEGRVSPADIIRLVWRGRNVASLPEGKTSADFLDPAVQARLETVMAGERNQDWRTRGFFLLGLDLMNDKAGFQRGGRNAVDAVRGAARRARVPGESVGIVRGDEIVDNLLSQPPGTYAPCVAAGVGAAEAGPEGFDLRAEDWRARRVPEVIANPLDFALSQCWPWGDPEIGQQLRGQWLTALSTALDQPGVTLAVAPLRLLAEPGGVLDGLEAQGFEVVGPEWK